MTSAQAVGSLPGGGEFVQLWEQVDGDAGAIGDLASVFTKGGSEVASVQQGVSTSAAGVNGGWNGPAADAFAGYMGKMSEASKDLHDGMTRAASDLTKAASAVSEAKSRLDSIANSVLDAVQGLEHDAPSPDDPDVDQKRAALDQAIRDEVRNGCAEATPVVNTLSSTLGDAATSVSAAVATGGYLHMKPPGDGSYLPSSGGHIDWQAVPKASTDATSPASAGSSGNGGGGTGGGGIGGGTGGGGTGGGGIGGGGTSSGAPAAQPTGDVKTWIEQASAILEQNGIGADKISAADINTIIEHESGGNPHAQNNTDSNAAAGHPSKGLMQCIDSTFNAHSLPGHNDIWNPVDNIIAGVRYALSRYGSLDNVPGIEAVHSGGSYVGY
ncbi:MAG: transglycosylase SLT domain-containing protein [Jatrophihabitans sp.]